MSLESARQALQQAKAMAVLTGAGISSESGIPTFRGAGGMWRNYRPEELATPEAYARNPELIWEWYAMRFETVIKAKPNKAHYLLAELEQKKQVMLVTQNVDGLHTRAHSKKLLELHGNITYSRCEQCGCLDKLQPGFSIPPRCSKCTARARPNVVWFGESLPVKIFEQALQAFGQADVALVIGTSGVVEPAASLVRLAVQQGAYVIEINPQPTPLSSLATLSLQMVASQGLSLLLNSDA